MVYGGSLLKECEKLLYFDGKVFKVIKILSRNLAIVEQNPFHYSHGHCYGFFKLLLKTQMRKNNEAQPKRILSPWFDIGTQNILKLLIRVGKDLPFFPDSTCGSRKMNRYVLYQI